MGASGRRSAPNRRPGLGSSHRLASACGRAYRADMNRVSSCPIRPARVSLVAAALLLAVATSATAQGPREIGRTAANNPVLVEPRTVKREGSLLSAIIRVKFAKAVKVPGGDWWSSRTRLVFDCTNRQVKVFESWYYGDTTWHRIASHSVSGQPAFGTVMGGSMTSVGYDVLCPVR